ncbi:MAG: type IX secretion system membrane protein PorP/SprF [Bacteroidetes bacterium]|nr:MAG: type IX secretion system membrane protein PorP/SprF [Bacteroidota bacterium]
MLMKKFLLSVSFLGLFAFVYAQQDPQFSQNMFNRLYPNPGYAGSTDAICGTLLGRGQWLGWDGAPKTALLSVHGPVRKIHGGVGLNVSQDMIGQEQTFNLKLGYAYRMSLGAGKLGVGLGLGLANKALGNNWVAIDDINSDQSIPANGASDMNFDMDLGVYYNTDKLFVGFSSTHLTQSQFKNVNLSYELTRHYYIMAGYIHEFNPSLSLQPSVFIKSDATSAQIDINAIAIYNNQFWGGVSYRYQDAIVPMIGVMYPMGPGTLKFGYSYDFTLSDMKQGTNGKMVQTHEISLGYCFNVPEVPDVQKHKTVRFL